MRKLFIRLISSYVLDINNTLNLTVTNEDRDRSNFSEIESLHSKLLAIIIILSICFNDGPN